MAGLLVAGPLLLVATHRYCVPFTPVVALLTVNVVVVAPPYGGDTAVNVSGGGTVDQPAMSRWHDSHG
jgi:hypothetical protein